MSDFTEGFCPELRVPVKPMIIALSALTLGVLLSFEDMHVRGCALLICAALVAAWLIDTWKPWLGKWFVIALEIAIIGSVSQWPGMSGVQALMAIPVGQAAGMINIRAAAATALATSALLLRLAITGTSSWAMSGASLLLVWAVLGIMGLIYYYVYRVAHWSWDNYCHAQSLIKQARDSAAEAKQAMDDLSHANRQLALTNERLDALRLIAEEAQQSKATFVAKVSHEFRTPLNIIIGLADLLVSTPEVYDQEIPAAVMEDLQVIRRNCEHLSSMVSDVLDLSQAEAGRLVLQREEVDLRELIDEALQVVRPLLDKKGLSLEVAIPDSTPSVYCDRTRIRQVILNLVSNAVRFTEEGGIAVRVTTQEQHVLVSVEDSGSGIPEGHLESIFDAFSQAEDKLWRSRGGTGLGLTVSRQFVERHGGKIWVKSQVGVGSTFSFMLPIKPLPEHTVGAGRWISESWQWVHRNSWAAPNMPTKPRVVLCDKDGYLANALAHHAEEVEFVKTNDLRLASQQTKQCPAHAVIVRAASRSQLWPLVDQARSVIRDTPIIGCVASQQPEQITKPSVVNSLTKPVTRTQLEAAIRGLGKPLQRLLVVDDDSEILRLWTRILMDYDPAMEVVPAANGRQALEALHTSPPDLMLLDIVLPDLSGWQILTIKEQDEATRDIPVILVSAQDMREQPAASEALVATIGSGLSPTRLLRCSLAVSSLMLKND